MKARLPLLILAALLSAALVRAADAAAPDKAPAAAPAAPAPDTAASLQNAQAGAAKAQPAAGDEITALLKYADSTYKEGRLDLCIIAYDQLLRHKLTRDQQRVVLLGFARALRKKGDLTKSVAVYEKLLKDYPLGDDAPQIYLELGRTMRAMGAYKSAISSFYSVINSTIKLPEDGAAKYRQLAKTAQFEIAETHFLAGQYMEASRFYSRLRLLDLAPVDRAKAHFKSAYSLYLAKDYLGTVTQLRSFLETNPDDENVPEAHYLLAVCYRRLNRQMEAMVEALTLLRVEKTKTAKDPKRWAYWQRRTGNQIANEFYEQGDVTDALTIYQTLADLSSEPSWRLPVIYQIGLCEERLGQMQQAVASYKSILDNLNAPAGDSSTKSELSDLGRMATWRLGQIKWQQDTEQRLNSLLPQNQTALNSTPPPSNDSGGNPTSAPTAVR